MRDLPVVLHFLRDEPDAVIRLRIAAEPFSTYPVCERDIDHVVELAAHLAAYAEHLFPLLLPDQLQEVGAAVVGAPLALGGQRAFHHHLGRDARVVGAGHPERLVAGHAPPADDHVLHRLVEPVAHVEHGGSHDLHVEVP